MVRQVRRNLSDGRCFVDPVGVGQAVPGPDPGQLDLGVRLPDLRVRAPVPDARQDGQGRGGPQEGSRLHPELCKGPRREQGQSSESNRLRSRSARLPIADALLHVQDSLADNFVESWIYSSCLNVIDTCEEWKGAIPLPSSPNVDPVTKTAALATKADLFKLAISQVSSSFPRSYPETGTRLTPHCFSHSSTSSVSNAATYPTRTRSTHTSFPQAQSAAHPTILLPHLPTRQSRAHRSRGGSSSLRWRLLRHLTSSTPRQPSGRSTV